MTQENFYYLLDSNGNSIFPTGAMVRFKATMLYGMTSLVNSNEWCQGILLEVHGNCLYSEAFGWFYSSEGAFKVCKVLSATGDIKDVVFGPPGYSNSADSGAFVV